MNSTPWTHPQFDPVAFSLGPVSLHWYGLMYLAAFASFLILGRFRLIHWTGERLKLTVKDLDDLLLFGVLGVVVGGRLGYVLFYKPAYYLAHPFEIIAIWEGGMAFHGGIVGVAVALFWLARRRGFSPLSLGDYIAPLVPLGLGFGRLGNFINGELWGRVTDSQAPWAMIFPQAGDGLARHPSQLYQMALEGIALFVVVWWFSAKPRPRGAVLGVFLAGYGLCRFIAELAREPDSFLGLLALGLSMGQWLSIPMILLGAAIAARSYQRSTGGRPNA